MRIVWVGIVIKRVGPVSCAKVAAALYALMGLPIGFVVTLIGAALYNLVAGWVGGVEMDVS